MNETNHQNAPVSPASRSTDAPDAHAETAKPRRNWRTALPNWSLWLSLGVLLWFALAAFGPKFGLIDWRTGLGFMIREAGVWLLAISALFAIFAFAFAFLKTPRGPWWKAALAMAIPAVLFMGLLTMRAQADAVPPIYDVSTDLRDPPAFSRETMALRTQLDANPVNDYGIPLGQLEMWAGVEDEALKAKNHADVIAEEYADLQPIILGNVDRDEAFDAIVAAMGEIGLQDVRRVDGSNTVEGVAETFAFGFRDDVVARVADGQIDLRSVSRVGLSDLGYNAERLRELSQAIEERLAR